MLEELGRIRTCILPFTRLLYHETFTFDAHVATDLFELPVLKRGRQRLPNQGAHSRIGKRHSLAASGLLSWCNSRHTYHRVIVANLSTQVVSED